MLAGFMRILGPEAVARFPNRIVNIHPSLLPAFPGLDAVSLALAAGVKVTGVTVHFVDEQVDHGPIIAQRAVPVLPGDDKATLHDRIQIEEHDLYPRVVAALLANQLTVEGRTVRWVRRAPVKRALISVHDKTGLIEFCRRLAACGIDLISSGGTAAALADAGLAVTSLSDLTGFPEILGGRVKTLHPRVHGAILARPDDPAHRLDLDEHDIKPIELVVSNLYPFELDPSLEQIDIGGVALTRAAAKNHEFVGVVIDPSQYDSVAAEIETGGLLAATRLDLAQHAILRTADYDTAIAKWLTPADEWPDRFHIALEKTGPLRYGENPHRARLPTPKLGVQHRARRDEIAGADAISSDAARIEPGADIARPICAAARPLASERQDAVRRSGCG